MSINFRKVLYKIFGKSKFWYDLCDFQRYRPWTTLCATSERLATEWCPTTIKRKFRAGRAPSTLCYQHSAPRPVPGPQPQVKHRVGIGRPAWLFAEGPLKVMLQAYKDHKISFFRMFLWVIYRDVFPYQVQEWRWDVTLKKYYPIWRVVKGDGVWDEDWWFTFDTYIKEIANSGLEGIITLLDQGSIRQAGEGKEARHWWEYLWNCVPQDKKCRPYLLRFWDRAFEVMNKYNLQYRVELFNELFFPDMRSPENDNRYQYLSWASGVMKDRYGVNKDKLVLSGGPNLAPLLQFFKFYSPHGQNSPDWVNERMSLVDKLNIPMSRVIMSGDGGGGRGVPGLSTLYKNISIEDAIWVAKYMKRRQIEEFEYWDQTNNKNVKDFCSAPLDAMTRELGI